VKILGSQRRDVAEFVQTQFLRKGIYSQGYMSVIIKIVQKTKLFSSEQLNQFLFIHTTIMKSCLCEDKLISRNLDLHVTSSS
jgi:hypothetical protein